MKSPWRAISSHEARHQKSGALVGVLDESGRKRIRCEGDALIMTTGAGKTWEREHLFMAYGGSVPCTIETDFRIGSVMQPTEGFRFYGGKVYRRLSVRLTNGYWR